MDFSAIIAEELKLETWRVAKALEEIDTASETSDYSEEPAVPYKKAEDYKDKDTKKLLGRLYEYPQYNSIEEAQQLMQNYKVEHALVFNQNGICICEIVGKNCEVKVDFLKDTEGKIILIHNHPEGSIFSSFDLMYTYTNRSFIKELRVVCGNNTYIYNPMECTMLKLEENVLNIRDIILERDKDLLKTKESRAKLYYTYREEIWNFLAAHCKGVTVIKNGRNTLEV